MKESKSIEFMKYMGKKIVLEPIKVVKELGRQLLYPKGWFGVMIIVFFFRIVGLIPNTHDKAIALFVVILILWEQYKKWYDEWVHKQRTEQREKAIEQMKGK